MVLASRRASVVALTLALVGAGVAVSSPAVAANPVPTLGPGVVVINSGTLAAPEFLVEVNCDLVLGDGDYTDFLLGSARLPIPADATVRLELSGCTQAEVLRYDDGETRVTQQFTPLGGATPGVAQEFPSDWNDYDIVALDSTVYEIGPNVEFTVTEADFATSRFTVLTPLAIPVPNPQGTLVEDVTLTLPASASDVMTVVDDLQYYDSNNDLVLGGIAGCRISMGDHLYSETEIDIDSAGLYTFRVAGVSPQTSKLVFTQDRYYLSEPFLALYSTFTPANGHLGVLACNDDSDLDPESEHYITSSGDLLSVDFPQFSATLQPGTYTLVLTSARSVTDFTGVSTTAGTSGSFSPAAFGTNESANIELWFAQSQLAATGPSPISGGMLAAGLALVTLGGLVFATRRMWSRA